MVILELIHGNTPNFAEGPCLLDSKPVQAQPDPVVTHSIQSNRMVTAGDEPLEFLTYQLWMVGYWLTMAMTGNGGLGFDTGEGA